MAELDKLKQLIYSPDKALVKPGAPYPQTLHPDVAENAREAKHDPTHEVLTRVATKMQASIRHAGEGSADALLGSRLRGMTTLSRPLRPELILKSVGGILYDQEWTGNLSQVMIPDHTTLDGTSTNIAFGSNYIFDMMLLPCPVRSPWWWSRQRFLDVGWKHFENFSRFLTAVACRWNDGHLPEPAPWEYIARKMDAFEIYGLDVWDAATLIYYYDTHREPVDSESAKGGWTGYTGVLQEMIDEVPKRGTDRLARKSSLDVNLLIPKFVSNREKRELMLYKARRLAQEYHLSVSEAERGDGWLDAITNFSFDAYGG